jgi:hypothetical protein
MYDHRCKKGLPLLTDYPIHSPLAMKSDITTHTDDAILQGAGIHKKCDSFFALADAYSICFLRLPAALCSDFPVRV